MKAGLEREEEVKRQSELSASRQQLESEIEGLTKLCMQLEGNTPQARKRSQQHHSNMGGAAQEEELLERLKGRAAGSGARHDQSQRGGQQAVT